MEKDWFSKLIAVGWTESSLPSGPSTEITPVSLASCDKLVYPASVRAVIPDKSHNPVLGGNE